MADLRPYTRCITYSSK